MEPFRFLRSVSGVLVAALVAGSSLVAAARAEPSNPASASSTVVFVCLHGSVKSQMAAAHFNRIARARGLPYQAISRGLSLDPAIPQGIRDGLAADGLAPLDDVPNGLTPAEATRATRVFAFDAVPSERSGDAAITYWTDVPPATKDYGQARDAIVRHIEQALDSLASSK